MFHRVSRYSTLAPVVLAALSPFSTAAIASPVPPWYELRPDHTFAETSETQDPTRVHDACPGRPPREKRVLQLSGKIEGGFYDFVFDIGGRIVRIPSVDGFVHEKVAVCEDGYKGEWVNVAAVPWLNGAVVDRLSLRNVRRSKGSAAILAAPGSKAAVSLYRALGNRAAERRTGGFRFEVLPRAGRDHPALPDLQLALRGEPSVEPRPDPASPPSVPESPEQARIRTLLLGSAAPALQPVLLELDRPEPPRPAKGKAKGKAKTQPKTTRPQPNSAGKAGPAASERLAKAPLEPVVTATQLTVFVFQTVFGPLVTVSNTIDAPAGAEAGKSVPSATRPAR